MSSLRIACVLSAFLCVGAHAENCSGGANGGMDDTGNQCSSPGMEVGAEHSTLTLERIAAATARPPADRISRSVDPASETPTGVWTETSGEATCSGGPGGGADATGNQCSQADFADRVSDLLAHGR